jgi:RNA polymerase sigma-70 factor (ECF subfamily)
MKMQGRGDPLLDSCPGEVAGLEESLGLLARAREGDKAALSALVERHHEQLLRVVRIRLGRGMRALLESGDVVQETYQALVQEIGGLRLERGDDLVQWLARVATNRIRDAHDRAHAARRDVGRERPLDPVDAASGEPPPALAASQTSPSDAAWRSEVREALDAAIASLPEDWREAILLRDYCGASWERIAEALGRPVHASQQLHQRAWIRVRRLVEPRLRG